MAATLTELETGATWLLRGEALQTSTVREVTGAEPRTFAAWVRAHLFAFA